LFGINDDDSIEQAIKLGYNWWWLHLYRSQAKWFY